MPTRMDWRKAVGRQHLAVTAIFLFTITSMAILLGNQFSTLPPSAPARESPQVTALASAMPDWGWAPLTVYYSAYGSRAEGAAITRYEWDLDGNGRFDHAATPHGGYASYTYSKPGEYTITIRVTDGQGRFATDQVTVSVRMRASSSVDYWTVFDDSRVRRIDIRLTQSDWDQMWANHEAKLQVRADTVIFGEPLNDVGFRMRGQFSLRSSGLKKPWKIDTDAYVDGQEFHNLRQLMLLNNIGDPSMLKEKLSYEMMEFTGVPASHVSYVELWIDITDDGQPAQYWGVYTLVERVDNKYLANRFGQDSVGGNLYKASHAQRGPMDLKYYGEQIEDYPHVNGQVEYGKMNNEENADYSDIIRLCRVLDGTEYAGDADFMHALEAVVNVDDFLRYIAVVTILDNWDSYPHSGNNYYLFNNPLSGRFEWIPWDLTWGGNINTPLLGRTEPLLMDEAPMYDKVFAVDAYQRQYAAYVDLLLRYWFNTTNITEKVQAYHRMIAPYVSQATGDLAFTGTQPMFPSDAFINSWEGLINFANQRNAFLTTELQQVWPGDGNEVTDVP
jgi:spore coat protein H